MKKEGLEGFTYEKAYSRLEEILEKLNDRLVSLDDSIALYEEANKLMNYCSQQLGQAEKKIEMIKKDASGYAEVDEEGVLQTAPLPPMTP